MTREMERAFERAYNAPVTCASAEAIGLFAAGADYGAKTNKGECAGRLEDLSHKYAASAPAWRHVGEQAKGDIDDAKAAVLEMAARAVRQTQEGF